MELSNDKKQKLKKYAIFTLMGIICAASMWLIFAPSEKDKEKELEGIGFNSEIPQPKKDGIVDDKLSAYTQEQINNKQSDKMKSLQDLASMLGNNPKDELNLMSKDDDSLSGVPESTQPRNAIANSARSYQDINRSLGRFYEQPKKDVEKERLQKELDNLKSELSEKDNSKSAVDQQLELMEKSYQLAAKYMPNSSGSNSQEGLGTRIAKGATGKKANVVSVGKKKKQIVSSLTQYLDDDDLFAEYDQERNDGFNKMQNLPLTDFEKNTISVSIDGQQIVTDGQLVRLRLSEDIQAGVSTIPQNTVITGVAKIQGERLGIQVSNIGYQDYIIRTELVAYDTDGQKGLNIPGSMEVKAVKEVLANMGNNLGTSITLSQSAGQQIASDLSKGVIQGTSQLFAKKIQQVKVTLKSGHKLFLMSADNE